MKKSLFTLAIAVIALLGCNNSQAKNNNNDTAGAPAETVASNEGGTTKLTKAIFLEKVWDYENSPKEWKYKGDKPALIDFYADWCAPCRKAAPILEDLSKEYEGKINIYKIDTQKERELASVFGIQGIPAFLYIPVEGKPVMMSGIGRTDEQTKNMFKENIGKYLLTKN
ncbi:MAG: thioredoxin domain-containing protein [Bacteroidota bacterium]